GAPCRLRDGSRECTALLPRLSRRGRRSRRIGGRQGRLVRRLIRVGSAEDRRDRMLACGDDRTCAAGRPDPRPVEAHPAAVGGTLAAVHLGDEGLRPGIPPRVPDATAAGVVEAALIAAVSGQLAQRGGGGTGRAHDSILPVTTDTRSAPAATQMERAMRASTPCTNAPESSVESSLASSTASSIATAV